MKKNEFQSSIVTVKGAVEVLKKGEVVAFPTETVYGLGGDAQNSTAIEKIYTIKGRPTKNPLIIHVSNPKEVSKYVDFGEHEETFNTLSEKFWPGPLTMVFRKKENCSIVDEACAGLDTIAIRCPAHPMAQELLKEFGGPIAAPSANISGHVSPTKPEHVWQDLFDQNVPIIEGGSCTAGLESTIIDLSKGDLIGLLRVGVISIVDLMNATQKAVMPLDIIETLKAPGMMKHHYAPMLPLRTSAESPLPGEAFLGFGDIPFCNENLSPSGNLKEAAQNLYHMLRSLDEPAIFSGIAVAPIPNESEGIAINDRLLRGSIRNNG